MHFERAIGNDEKLVWQILDLCRSLTHSVVDLGLEGRSHSVMQPKTYVDSLHEPTWENLLQWTGQFRFCGCSRTGAVPCHWWAAQWGYEGLAATPVHYVGQELHKTEASRSLPLQVAATGRLWKPAMLGWSVLQQRTCSLSELERTVCSPLEKKILRDLGRKTEREHEYGKYSDLATGSNRSVISSHQNIWMLFLSRALIS